MEDAPPALPWHEYAAAVQRDYEELLESRADDEAAFQRFFEQHPCMLPQEKRRHDGWPWAVLTQPRLAGYDTHFGDFMLIEENSARFTGVFVEIETPGKPWTTDDGKQAHELTYAIEQPNEWRRWFRDANRAEQFRRYHGLTFREDFRQRYVLVFGRRKEAQANETFAGSRADRFPPDLDVMTFDRLTPLADQANFVCIRRDGSAQTHEPKFTLAGIPACFQFDALSERLCRTIRMDEEAVRRAPYMSDERKRFVIEHWRELAEKEPTRVLHGAALMRRY